jgi:hypothetical protein
MRGRRNGHATAPSCEVVSPLTPLRTPDCSRVDLSSFRACCFWLDRPMIETSIRFRCDLDLTSIDPFPESLLGPLLAIAFVL